MKKHGWGSLAALVVGSLAAPAFGQESGHPPGEEPEPDGQTEALAAEEEAEDESPLGGGVEADFLSRYMWHALPLTTTPVLQPSAWVDLWMCNVWTFANVVLPGPALPMELDEVDVGVGCGFEVGNLEVTPGLATYLYPDGSDVTVELTLDLVYYLDWFRLVSRNAVDLIVAAGAFATETGVGFGVEWETWSLEGALLAVFSEGTFNEENIGEDKAALTATMFELAGWIGLVDALYLRPHASVSVLLPDFVADAFGERAVVEFGFAVGAEL